jgi:hypothetical protein
MTFSWLAKALNEHKKSIRFFAAILRDTKPQANPLPLCR